MIYLVEIDGQNTLRVDLREEPRGVWKARVGDHDSIELQMRGRDDEGRYVFAIGDEVHSFHIDQNCTKPLLDDGTRMARVDVARAGDVILDHDRQFDTDWEVRLQTLDSNITGIVLDVLVEAGQRVEQGQPMVVVEAMKMENTLGAPMDGWVDEIAIDCGQTVRAGDTLVTFD